MKVYLVGPGRVGRALLVLLPQGGHAVVGVGVRRSASAEAVVSLSDAPVDVIGAAPPPHLAEADLLWLTVPDDAIASVARSLAPFVPAQCVVAHASGAVPASLLRQCVPRAAAVVSIHPLYPFVDPHRDAQGCRRAAWFVEGEPGGIAAARSLLEPLGIEPQILPPDRKARYHAAAVLASNAVVALGALAVDLLASLGLSPDKGLAALLPLMEAAVGNLGARGLPGALTGPVSRGDVEVVRRHLAALEEAPRARDAYRALMRRAVGVARAQGFAPSERLDALEALLGDSNEMGEKGRNGSGHAA